MRRLPLAQLWPPPSPPFAASRRVGRGAMVADSKRDVLLGLLTAKPVDAVEPSSRNSGRSCSLFGLPSLAELFGPNPFYPVHCQPPASVNVPGRCLCAVQAPLVVGREARQERTWRGRFTSRRLLGVRAAWGTTSDSRPRNQSLRNHLRELELGLVQEFEEPHRLLGFRRGGAGEA